MKLLKNSLFLLTAVLLFIFQGCKEEVPEAITVLSIVAEGTDLQSGNTTTVDLNTASAVTDVPLDATIIITFNKEIDATTATSSNFMLNDGANSIAMTVNANGTSVTLSPDEDLVRGLTYSLTMAGGILGADGGSFSETTRSFTAAGRADVTPPQDAAQLAYWRLDGNAFSAVGNYDGTETSVTYGEDRFGNQASAAFFDGDVSLIEIPNGDQFLNSNFTLSFWMMVDSTNHKNGAGTGNAGHFVMGVGDVYGFFIEVGGTLGSMKFTGRYSKEDATTTANDFFFNGDGKDANNGGWVGVEYEKDLTSTGGLGPLIDQIWVQVVITYDAASNKRSLYIDGERMETDALGNTTGLATVNGLVFDDSGAGADIIGKSLALGFNHDKTTTHWNDTEWGDYNKPGANHFKGGLDDIRFFNVALSETEVMDLYIAEGN